MKRWQREESEPGKGAENPGIATAPPTSVQPSSIGENMTRGKGS